MICEFCGIDIPIYDEKLPLGRLYLTNTIGVDDRRKELYSVIKDCDGNQVENIRIDINYCPKCGREL